MIINNVRDGVFYIEDTITLMIKRNKILLTNNQFEVITNDLYLLFQDVKLPNEDLFEEITKILNLVSKLNDKKYLYYKGKNINRGNSPKKQRERDIQKINNFEQWLIEFYSDYIRFKDGKPSFYADNAPDEIKNHFRLLQNLKENINKEGTIEYQSYKKPDEPNKNDIKLIFKKIEIDYKIKFNPNALDEFITAL